MIPILENAVLGTDLDCQNLDLLNIARMTPVPADLVDIDDPRLYDPRVPFPASVTDESVAATAGIQQSKLSLNGVIPFVWRGYTSDRAAPGDGAEYVAHKGAAGGYAALDSSGRVPSAHLTTTASTGTVSSVDLSLPPQLSLLVEAPITDLGTFTVSWNSAPDQSWFGVNGAVDLSSSLSPSFQTGQIPAGLVPAFSATKFTSGTFALAQLPVAAMGTGHARGIVPDPGATGGMRDYLGRDMKWHKFDGSIPYQPRAAMPAITLMSWNATQGIVKISSSSSKFLLFYRVTDVSHPEIINLPFTPVFPGNSITVNVPNGFFVEAYAARDGYNNSSIASYTVVTPLMQPTT